MATTVTRTSSGNGAMIVVVETPDELAERQQRRLDQAASLRELEFTPGQVASLRSTRA
ncbi:MAG TPA: hypothetical protein VFG00_07995 [Acidothermaceae bacterium]|nr:hypothetical protein [Acidothermaceae bacterium]